MVAFDYIHVPTELGSEHWEQGRLMLPWRLFVKQVEQDRMGSMGLAYVGIMYDHLNCLQRWDG